MLASRLIHPSPTASPPQGGPFDSTVWGGDAGLSEAVRVLDLNELPAGRRAAMVRQIARTAHAVWGHCTDEFATRAQAEAVLEGRLDAHDEAVFAVVDEDDGVIGTASIGSDDFYPGFSASNGIATGHVGRDLHTAPAWRGVIVNGLKVWEHLLEARLRWIERHGGAQLTVFTEPCCGIDLPAVYARMGATVLKTGLDHRVLGPGTITLLGYPVQHGLERLEAMRRQRRTGIPR